MLVGTQLYLNIVERREIADNKPVNTLVEDFDNTIHKFYPTFDELEIIVNNSLDPLYNSLAFLELKYDFLSSNLDVEKTSIGFIKDQL